MYKLLYKMKGIIDDDDYEVVFIGDEENQDPLEIHDKIADLSQVCKICLITGCEKMSSLEEGVVSEAYKKIIGKDLLGINHACWECGARLKAALRLRTMAERAHQQLTILLKQHRYINPLHIDAIDRKNLDLAFKMGNSKIETFEVEGTVANVTQDDPVNINEDSHANFQTSLDQHNKDIPDVIGQRNNSIGLNKNPTSNFVISSIEIVDIPEKITTSNTDNNDVTNKIDNDLVKKDIDMPKLDNQDSTSERGVKTLKSLIIQKNSEVKRRAMPKEMQVNNELELAELFEIKAVKPDEQKRKFNLSVERSKGKRNKCPVCGRCFFNNTYLLQHQDRHMKSYGNYICSVCKIRSKSLLASINHLRTHSIEYICRKCEYSTSLRISAEWHCKKHKSKTKCLRCPKILKNGAKCKSHMKKCCEKPTPCEYCGSLCKCPNTHKQEKHADDLKKAVKLMMVYCEACRKYFASESAYDKHQKRTHTSKKLNGIVKQHLKVTTPRKRAMTCDQCGADFPTLKEYMSHRKQHHPGLRIVPRSRIMCDQCGLFCNKGSYWKHRGQHRNDTYICDYCNKVFNLKSSLIHHMIIHTDRTSDYVCHICGKKFLRKSNLQRHFSETHENELSPAKCPICPRCFGTTNFLLEHFKKAHPYVSSVHLLY